MDTEKPGYIVVKNYGNKGHVKGGDIGNLNIKVNVIEDRYKIKGIDLYSKKILFNYHSNQDYQCQ